MGGKSRKSPRYVKKKTGNLNTSNDRSSDLSESLDVSKEKELVEEVKSPSLVISPKASMEEKKVEHKFPQKTEEKEESLPKHILNIHKLPADWDKNKLVNSFKSLGVHAKVDVHSENGEFYASLSFITQDELEYAKDSILEGEVDGMKIGKNGEKLEFVQNLKLVQEVRKESESSSSSSDSEEENKKVIVIKDLKHVGDKGVKTEVQKKVESSSSSSSDSDEDQGKKVEVVVGEEKKHEENKHGHVEEKPTEHKVEDKKQEHTEDKKHEHVEVKHEHVDVEKPQHTGEKTTEHKVEDKKHEHTEDKKPEHTEVQKKAESSSSSSSDSEDQGKKVEVVVGEDKKHEENKHGHAEEKPTEHKVEDKKHEHTEVKHEHVDVQKPEHTGEKTTEHKVEEKPQLHTEEKKHEHVDVKTPEHTVEKVPEHKVEETKHKHTEEKHEHVDVKTPEHTEDKKTEHKVEDPKHHHADEKLPEHTEEHKHEHATEKSLHKDEDPKPEHPTEKTQEHAEDKKTQLAEEANREHKPASDHQPNSKLEENSAAHPEASKTVTNPVHAEEKKESHAREVKKPVLSDSSSSSSEEEKSKEPEKAKFQELKAEDNESNYRTSKNYSMEVNDETINEKELEDMGPSEPGTGLIGKGTEQIEEVKEREGAGEADNKENDEKEKGGCKGLWAIAVIGLGVAVWFAIYKFRAKIR